MKKQLASGWTGDKVRALSNEAILARLAGFGVRTSTSEFVQLASAEHFIGACDLWLEVWTGFKLHFTPAIVSVRDVDIRFDGTEYFFNWCQEFEQELGNAGAVDPRYLRARVRYVNEFMAQFGAEADEVELMGNFLRAEAEALWSLGEPAAAEERFEALIRHYPQFAWGHIGLADCFWLGPDPTPEPKEYARAEAIYQRALAEPTLEMRADVLDRLADLHLEQGNTDAAAVWRQQAEVERRQWLEPLFPERAVTPSIMGTE